MRISLAATCTLSPPPPLAGEGREGALATSPDARWTLTERARTRARELRRNLTDAERIVWYGVRAHQLNGAGFRRQAPIGPYIVDFVSHAAKLIVELDGGHHFEDEQEKRDARRTRHLERKGYCVLRFSNLDAMTNRNGVLERIAETVQAAAAPSLPSPAGGGAGESGASRAVASTEQGA